MQQRRRQRYGRALGETIGAERKRQPQRHEDDADILDR